MSNQADKYFKELLQDIEDNGVWSKKPRTRWSSDNTPANYKSVYDKVYRYDISKGEFPIITTRNTALRGCFEEMRWIYQLQSNIIEDAHSSIKNWWIDFSEEQYLETSFLGEHWSNEKNRFYNEGIRNSIKKTYGYVVKKYDLMNKLLNGLETNPESRRHIINLWDNQSQSEDPSALPPCVYMTKWRVRNQEDFKYVDFSLYQRSRDVLMTASINPAEYVFLQMMVCGHLTWKTGITHKPGILNHYVEDEHVYDRNYWALAELLDREPTGLQPKIQLICEPKNFYDYRWEDFKISGIEGITPLSKKLEIAI